LLFFNRKTYSKKIKSLRRSVITQKNFFLFYTKYLLENDVEIQK